MTTVPNTGIITVADITIITTRIQDPLRRNSGGAHRLPSCWWR
jgi:hypothetical protein